ncbi:MAG TPA: PSD1 and planctomycete cytochrome C domain-containing protein [Pirellulales bacterium]
MPVKRLAADCWPLPLYFGPLAALLLGCLAAGSTLGAVPSETVSTAQGTPGGGAKLDRSDEAFFEQHVRPLLATHCYECHSNQSKIVQGGLLLDSKPGWQKGGDSGPVIVPGQPDKSLLVRALEYADEDVQMPPRGKLATSEIALVSEWVRRGAPDPRITAAPAAAKRTIDLAAGRKHWAFQPLASPKPPALPDASWCRTPLDPFVLDRQRKGHVSPNPIADRRTLIRRAYFDLLGLPPEPEAIAAFVNDPAADAYDRLLDRLLASRHFGEHWARHWLDLARWAESHGFEQDYDRPHAYTYRDFVIRALNQDLPYDTFVKWQLAGDEFEPDNPLALAATGFLAAGVHATQITANQAEKERYDELDDMARTAGTAMLGLTVGCARCHDHKFDPVSNEDYYRIVSTFTTTVRSHQLVNTDAADYRRRLASFNEQHRPVAAALAEYEQDVLRGKFDAWLVKQSKQPLAPRQWLVLDNLSVSSTSKMSFARQEDGSYLAGNLTQQFNESYTITADLPAGKIFALRIEALPDDSLPAGGPGLGAGGSFELKKVKAALATREKKSRRATANLVLAPRLDEVATGEAGKPVDRSWMVSQPAGRRQTVDWAPIPPGALAPSRLLVQPIGFYSPSSLTLTLDFDGYRALGRFRISLAAEGGPGMLDVALSPAYRNGLLYLDPARSELSTTALAAFNELHAKSSKPLTKLSDDQRLALFKQFCREDARWLELRAAVDQSLARRPRPQWQWMMIASEGVPAIRLNTQGPDFYEKTYQVKRGDPSQKLGESSAGFLQVLLRPGVEPGKWQQSPPAEARTSYRRRALANWMTDCDGGAGQLLARVVVNRLWQHHLGRGLVATPSDFGLAGEKPTHPELLDYLAGELVRGGWRLKPIHKLIMTSAVYMQTSDTDAARLKSDLDNRTIWHHEPQRLEAETVRDAMLAVSGLLDRTLLGPGLTEPEHHRRSIYFFVKRSRLVPMLMLFDAPDTLQDLSVRSETTVAPQALMLLNSPLVRQYAEGLAGRVMPGKAGEADQAIDRAYATALGREPTSAERKATTDFLAAQAAAYRAEHRDRPDALAWGDFCQVLLGMNEFIYVR